MTRADPISFPKAQIVPKTWGHEEIFISTPEYCGKLLHFKAGKYASLHFHALKKETWFCSRGQFRLTRFDLETGETLHSIHKEGDIIHIPAGNPHLVTAITDVIILETSTADFSTDTYRLSPSCPPSIT